MEISLDKFLNEGYNNSKDVSKLKDSDVEKLLIQLDDSEFEDGKDYELKGTTLYYNNNVKNIVQKYIHEQNKNRKISIVYKNGMYTYIGPIYDDLMDGKKPKSFKKYQDAYDLAIKNGYSIMKESINEAEKSEDEKASESIKWLIDNDWGIDNSSQGRASETFKALSFNNSDIANKFMDKINKFTSSLKIEDFK